MSNVDKKYAILLENLNKTIAKAPLKRILLLNKLGKSIYNPTEQNQQSMVSVDNIGYKQNKDITFWNFGSLNYRITHLRLIFCSTKN